MMSKKSGNHLWLRNDINEGVGRTTANFVYVLNRGNLKNNNLNLKIDRCSDTIFIPEYKVMVIVSKAVGDIAPNLVRRQLERLNIKTKEGIPIDRYEDFLIALDEATMFLCSRPIRSKMLKELRDLVKRYTSR